MQIKVNRHLLAVAFTVAGMFFASADSALGQAFSGTYTFGSSGSTTSFAYNGSAIANLTVSNLTQTGVSPSSSSGNFRATNWALDASVGTLTGTIDLAKYFQFTLTASPGYTFNLTDLNFGFGRSSTGPRQIQWRSSVDSYGAAIPSYASLGTGTSIMTVSSGVLTIQDTTSTGTNIVIALSGSSASYTNLTTIGFRFYGYNAEGAAGTGGLQGPLSFSGSLIAPALPESFWNGGTWVSPGPGTGGSGSWADGSGSWNPANAAVFGGAAGTVTSGSVTAATGMVFVTSGYTLSGGTITLSGSAASLNTINTGSTTPFSTTINSVLAGSAGMTKAGVGTLTLGGINTFIGTVAVNAGVLDIASDSALGDAANDISLAAATLKTTASIVMGSGRDMTGSGTLDIAPGTTLTASGSVNLTATTLSNSGTLALQGATRSLGVLTFGTAATVNGSGAISLTGLTATAVTSGSAIVNPAITFSSGDKTVDVGSGGTLVLNGDIAGTTGRIVKTGGGTLIASGSNTTSGYRVGAAGATPTNGGTVILAAAAASGTGQLQLNYGTLDSTAPFTFANGLSVGGRVGAVAVLGGTNAMTFSGSSNFFRASSTSGELRLDVNNDTTLAGVLGPTASGGGSATGVTIGGIGSLTIAGNAATFVDTITLQDTVDLMVNQTLGGGVNVGSATLLGGTGTISGAVQVLGGGILSPGLASSPGTLASGSNVLTGTSTSVFNFDLSAASQTIGGGVNDLITGITNLTLDGVLNVNGIGDFSTVTAGTVWRLFNYSGTLTDNVLSLGSMPTLAGGNSFVIDTSTPGQVNLAVVPEPGTIALAALGGLIAAGSAVRRRRRRSA